MGRDSNLRDECWKRYFGYKDEGYCYCCYKIIHKRYRSRHETRENDDYECGHILAYSKYPEYDNDTNVIPICHSCNEKMGNESADTYALLKGYSSYSIINNIKNLVEKN